MADMTDNVDPMEPDPDEQPKQTGTPVETADLPSEDEPQEPEKKPLDIHYAFSGATMAGESLMMCGLCSALLKDSGREAHTRWHEHGSV